MSMFIEGGNFFEHGHRGGSFLSSMDIEGGHFGWHVHMEGGVFFSEHGN